MSKSVRRLFGQFQPEHYNLHITPDAKALTFTGTVTITGKKVGRPSQRIMLHQNELKITKATLVKNDPKTGDKPIAVSRTNNHAKFDELRLHADEMIYPGNYTISLEFSGKITRPMNGMYPCYFEEGGKEKRLLATQFESHHAREVFPCIDEPEAKATFDLSLTTLADDVVVANTPVAKTTKQGNLKTTNFETTPKMSVYLLAYVIGDMKYKETKTKDGVAVRTYATPANVKLTDFALDVAVKCLEFYNDYFSIPYPLEKCDMIALPDFASGAMENWGCVTYREQCMLVDPKNTSLSTKQYVAMVVAHELAHQWFGNLVTMRWWTDLWLNEGFASWIEYMAIDKIFPEWQMWTQFITDEQQAAMRLDALVNTHAIEVPVKHPDEIRSIFDNISYGKGASVIHMLHEYLGPTDFRNGLSHYLKTHAYSNTDTVDLWHALAEVSGKPVEKFMDAWTSQPGFPIVNAHLEGGHLKLQQGRYFTNPEQDRDHQTLWPIPTNAEIEPAIFSKHEDVAKLAKGQTVVKLNRSQTGFYRVAYQNGDLHALAQTIASGKLSPLDRLGILSDAFETAKAGYSSSPAALDLLQYYADEDNNAVWDVISGGINSIRGVMDDDKLRESMKPYVRKLVQKQLARLGWEQKPKEDHFDTLLRPTLIGLAAISDETSVTEECLKHFNEMKSPEDLPADLRGIIYTTAARHGDEKTFKKLLKIHDESIHSEERTTLAAALTGFQQPAIIKQALGLITTDKVRMQDVSYWVAYSFMNRYSKRLTWDWMRDNWKWLTDNLGTDLSFSRMPMYSARCFSDETFLKEYTDFFKPHMTPGLERAYRQGIETIEWQSDWKQRDLKLIQEFFSKASQ